MNTTKNNICMSCEPSDYEVEWNRQNECIICYDNRYDEYKILENKKDYYETNMQFISECCKKPYHYSCLVKWCTKNNSCPNCRKPNQLDIQRPQCVLCRMIMRQMLNERISRIETEDMPYERIISSINELANLIISDSHESFH